MDSTCHMKAIASLFFFVPSSFLLCCSGLSRPVSLLNVLLLYSSKSDIVDLISWSVNTIEKIILRPHTPLPLLLQFFVFIFILLSPP